MNNDKQVKKPTKEELEAIKAAKEKIIKNNQIVKK
jgi:hypothetical protein